MNNASANMDHGSRTSADDGRQKSYDVLDHSIDNTDTLIPHIVGEFEPPNRYFQQERPATTSPLPTPPPKPSRRSIHGKISASISEQNIDKLPSPVGQRTKLESPKPMLMVMRNSSAKQSSSSRSSSTPTAVATTSTTGSSTSTSSVYDPNMMRSAKSTQSLVLPPITYDHLDQNGPPFLYESGYRFNVCHESFFSRNELLKYFPDQKLHMSVITWNMNSKPPTDYDKSLRELFHLKPFQPDNYVQEHLPEMFVLGLQEAPNSMEIIDTMKIGIQSVLGPNYALLQWSNVGVLHCSIWLRRELLWSCTTVQMIPIHSRHMAANRIKTKGAIALSFGLFGTLFLFINAHLNAHESKLQARINQLDKMEQILNLNWKEDNVGFDGNQPISSDKQLVAGKKHRHKHFSQLADNLKCQHRDWDAVFWFGDLNFRLELPIDMVLDTIRKIQRTDKPESRERYLKKLINSDQLSTLMQRGIVFKNFQEAQWPPSFLPTYKCRTNILSFRPDTDEEEEVYVSDLNRLEDVENSNSESMSSGSILSSSTATTTTGHSKNADDDTAIAEAAAAEAAAAVAPVNVPKWQPEQEEKVLKIYDIRSGRVPSFTDRILFSKCKTGGTRPGMDGERFSANEADPQTKCLYYNSVASLKSSDHKPVYALFEVALDSVGPKNPSTIKRLSKLVDDVGLMPSNDDGTKDSMPAAAAAAADHQKKGKTSGQKLRKLIRRNLLAFRKPNRISITPSNSASLGILPKSISRSSKVLDSQSSVSKNNQKQIATDSSLCLGRLGQFNAGAYDRETYLKGMQLRNRSHHHFAQDQVYQSLSMEEIKKLSKKPKHHASSYHHIPLIKSVSLESDIQSPSMPKDETVMHGSTSVKIIQTDQTPLLLIEQTDPDVVQRDNDDGNHNFAQLPSANNNNNNNNYPESAARTYQHKSSNKRNRNRVENAKFCKIL